CQHYIQTATCNWTRLRLPHYHFSPFSLWGLNTRAPTELLADHRALEPPDPIPNSEVKRCIADGSVGLPHVRVGHRQASNRKPRQLAGFFIGRLSAICCYYCPM